MISRASKVVEVHVPGVYFSSSGHKPLARRASDVSLAPWSHASAGAVPSEPDTQMRPSLSSSITKSIRGQRRMRMLCDLTGGETHGCIYWGTARREQYALAKGIWPEGGDLGAALWWESAYRSGGHSGAPRQRY